MLNNPLIQRYRYSALRPRQVWIYATIYISIIVLMLFINYTIYQYQNVFTNLDKFFRSVYYQLLTFQVIILWAWGFYNSGSAIKDEILEKSYDFFRMLPIPAWQKAIGILVGKNLIVLLLAGINFLLLHFFGLFGKVNVTLQIQILLLLVSITVLANSTALLSSIRAVPKKKSSNALVLILLLFFIIPALLNTMFALSEIKELQKYRVAFYVIKVPILLLISFIALYFSCWVIKGIIRKFNRELEPLFSRKGAFLFLLGYEFVAIGLFLPHLSEDKAITYFFWLTSLIPAVLILLGSLGNLDIYIEYSRFIQGRSRPGKGMMAPILLYSNLLVGLGLIAIWALFAIGTALAAGANILPNLYSVLVLFSFYMFALLLLELYAIYNSPNSKIGLLLGFIFMLHLFLPLILSAVMENATISLYSPLGYFGNIIATSDRGFVIDTSIWLINFLLCIIPTRLIWKQYSLILTARQKM